MHRAGSLAGPRALPRTWRLRSVWVRSSLKSKIPVSVGCESPPRRGRRCCAARDYKTYTYVGHRADNRILACSTLGRRQRMSIPLRDRCPTTLWTRMWTTSRRCRRAATRRRNHQADHKRWNLAKGDGLLDAAFNHLPRERRAPRCLRNSRTGAVVGHRAGSRLGRGAAGAPSAVLIPSAERRICCASCRYGALSGIFPAKRACQNTLQPRAPVNIVASTVGKAVGTRSVGGALAPTRLFTHDALTCFAPEVDGVSPIS